MMDSIPTVLPSKPQRRRILFLCHTLPYPLDAGVWLRTYNVLVQLHEAFDLTILCFERVVPGGQPSGEIEAARLELQRFGEVLVFPLPETHSAVGKLLVHLRSVLFRRVFTVFRHRTPAYDEALRALLGTNAFDLVHLDSLDLAGLLPLPTTCPVVCVHHNVESKLLKRRAAAARGIARAYFSLQARWQRQEERRWCPSFAMNIMVSDADAADLGGVAPESKCAVVPNGVDLEYFSSAPPGSTSRVVFVGGLNWYPNRDGFEFFATEIVPLIRSEHRDVEFDWVGTGTELVSPTMAAAAGIKLLGRVPDVRPIVHAARCFVVPLRVGGGSRLKILDAWAMGRAVVSTSVGCEGLAAEHDCNIVIADAPRDFATAVCRLLADDRHAERLGREARRTAERCYSWNFIGGPMRDAYENLCFDHASVRTEQKPNP